MKGYYLVYLGDKALKKQELQKAIYLYEKGITYHPKHYRAMYNLANIYVVYEDYYSALENYEKALSLRPDYEMARMNYAIILSETYNTDKAIEQYQKVIDNKPRFIKIPFILDNKKSHYYNIGVAYYNMGIAYRSKSLLAGLDKAQSRQYLVNAQKSYDEATKILKSYNSNYNLGLIHQLLKNDNQAGFYYCKAMELSPMEYEAHFNHALILDKMGEYSLAEEELSKAILLLSLKETDTVRIRYAYNVISEIYQRLSLFRDEKYYKKLEEIRNAPNTSKYKAGKLVLSDEKGDEALIKAYKTCAGKERFIGEK